MSSPRRYVLSSKELDVLPALGSRSDALIPELSSVVLIPPSALRATLSGLVSRKLVDVSAKDAVRLTPEGRMVFKSLPNGSGSGDDAVIPADDVVIGDSESQLSEADLDIAITDEVRKLMKR